MANSNFKVAPKKGEYVQANLSDAIVVKGCFYIHSDNSISVHVEYYGTEVALLAAGCLTSFMMASRAARPKRSTRRLYDEHGRHFTFHRSPTKAIPDRMGLFRRAELKIAMQLPGVRELFPGGIAVPAEARGDAGDTKSWWPTAPQDWKEKTLEHADVDLSCFEKIRGENWRGTGKVFGPRFRFADSDLQRLEAIVGRFRKELFETLEQAVVVDTQQQSSRPSHLRLVVDNTREVQRPGK